MSTTRLFRSSARTNSTSGYRGLRRFAASALFLGSFAALRAQSVPNVAGTYSANQTTTLTITADGESEDETFQGANGSVVVTQSGANFSFSITDPSSGATVMETFTLSGNSIIAGTGTVLAFRSVAGLSISENKITSASGRVSSNRIDISLAGRVLGNLDGDAFRIDVVGTVTLNGTVNPIGSGPTITLQPAAKSVTAGGSATFTVTATGAAPLSYQWRKDGTAITGATTSTLALTNVQSGNAGSYSVTVNDSVGSTTSSAVNLTVNPTAQAAPSRPAGAGAYASGPTQVIVTWRPPASGSSPTGYKLERATNSTFSAALSTSNLSGSFTSYLDTSATAGTTYYYRLSATNAAGSSAPTTTMQLQTPASLGTAVGSLINISTRARSTVGNGVTIGGFVVSGSVPKHVLVRAVGPTLTTQGLGATMVLQDPTIEVHDAGHGNAIIATNDNLGDNANAAEIVTTGARIGATPYAMADTKSAALLLTLQPGVYSFIARGKGDTSGIVLVEVYDAD